MNDDGAVSVLVSMHNYNQDSKVCTDARLVWLLLMTNRSTCCLLHTDPLCCGGRRPNGNHSFTFRCTFKNATPFPLATFACNTDGDDHHWLLCVLVLGHVIRAHAAMK